TIVVIDAIRNLGLLPKDESDSGAIAAKLNPWIRDFRKAGKTPFFLHHNRKGGGEHGEAIAGGHGLLGAVDMAVGLHADRAHNRRQIQAFARVIQPDPLLYERQTDGSLQAIGAPQEVALAELLPRVYQLLTDDWAGTSRLFKQLPEPKPSKRQFAKALWQLARDEKAERHPPIAQKAERKRVSWRRYPHS